MAIEFTEPAVARHIIYQSLWSDIESKAIRLRFIDADGNEHDFSTRPAQWQGALSFLFDNLTNAAELKDRIESYLVANEIIGGTIVLD